MGCGRRARFRRCIYFLLCMYVCAYVCVCVWVSISHFMIVEMVWNYFASWCCWKWITISTQDNSVWEAGTGGKRWGNRRRRHFSAGGCCFTPQRLCSQQPWRNHFCRKDKRWCSTRGIIAERQGELEETSWRWLCSSQNSTMALEKNIKLPTCGGPLSSSSLQPYHNTGCHSCSLPQCSICSAHS